METPTFIFASKLLAVGIDAFFSFVLREKRKNPRGVVDPIKPSIPRPLCTKVVRVNIDFYSSREVHQGTPTISLFYVPIRLPLRPGEWTRGFTRSNIPTNIYIYRYAWYRIFQCFIIRITWISTKIIRISHAPFWWIINHQKTVYVDVFLGFW